MSTRRPRHSFAEALLKARKAAKKTQEDVAREADVSVRTVARVEGKETEPSLETMFALAGVLPELKTFLPAA